MRDEVDGQLVGLSSCFPYRIRKRAQVTLSLRAHRTWFGVNGYTDSRQGVFSCRLEYPLANGTIVPARLPWGWYDGAHTNGARANPISLCSAYGLPYELYTLVVTVQPDQVSKGLGVRSDSCTPVAS